MLQIAVLCHEQYGRILPPKQVKLSCRGRDHLFLTGSARGLLEVALVLGEPLGDRRVRSGTLAEGHRLGELRVEVGSPVAQGGTEGDQSLREGQDDNVGGRRPVVAVHEALVGDVLGEVRQDGGHHLGHEVGVVPAQDDAGGNAHGVLVGAEEHVVHGGLRRG